MLSRRVDEQKANRANDKYSNKYDNEQKEHKLVAETINTEIKHEENKAQKVDVDNLNQTFRPLHVRTLSVDKSSQVNQSLEEQKQPIAIVQNNYERELYDLSVSAVVLQNLSNETHI